MLIFFFDFTVDTSGYDIIADIRVNDQGNDTLYHNGYKFCKNKINQHSINWICNKRKSQKCKMTASTTEINGIIMMKVNGFIHSHDLNSN